MKTALFGATGKTGRYLLSRLLDDGHTVVALGRDRARLASIDARAEHRLADLEDAPGVAAAIRDVDCVVSLAHARFIPQLLEALPGNCRHVVVTGSTRKFTRYPDAAAEAVRAGERAFLDSGVPGLMLHPSMIYGAPDDRNVNRLIGLIRRWPRAVPLFIPLPAGGRALVQPVFVDDVVDAYAAAVARPDTQGEPVIVAGPGPISYGEMLRTCADAIGRRARIVPVPLGVAIALSTIAPFSADEVRRLTEDKKFDVEPLKRRLGVAPRSFRAGIEEKLRRGWVQDRKSGSG